MVYVILLFQLGFVISTVLAATALVFYIVFVQMLHLDLPDGHLIHALLRT